ncbi:MAG: hypothetical protein HYS05_02920 [Acidobacteria bacterium]|nr:hypothetical protein [Acidobacteriota bacterium]
MRETLVTAVLALSASIAYADALNCNLTQYKAASGLTAGVADDTLTLTWDGDKDQEVRLRLAIDAGTPTIRDLAVRKKGAQWASLASNMTPEFRVVSGLRRATDQQLQPLKQLGVEITPAVLDQIRWEAFWDAPLNIPGGDAAHGGSTPPLEGIANQPGLPRQPEEVRRVTATYRAQSCEVKTNGARLEVTFPGAELGVFSGRLEYTVYKGTNLIQQAVVAKTDEPSVAYKYDAGLRGLAIQPASRIVWRDTSNLWQDYGFGGATNEAPVPLKTSNRLVVAEGPGGSIAAFPPPHRFFWAREIEFNLGYSWYRKDSPSSFAFGIRQAEREEEPTAMGRGAEDVRQNFALYSARPGTWQRMPVFFYVSAEPGQVTLQSALAFTRGDRFKPVAGHQVMATHFHTSFVQRLHESGSLDTKLPDLDAIKAAGINIFAPTDVPIFTKFVSGKPEWQFARGADRLKLQADYYEAARRHSDKNFLIMPDEEVFAGNLGGHNDLLLSKPLFWTQERATGQPFVEEHPTYGRVYHVGGQADMMEMAKRENALIFMPHPRSKGSTGFPDAIKDTAHFRHEHYRGIGYRWGMGVDGSETRLCDYRCLPLFDDLNNWVADVPTPPKYIQAISETYRKGPGDDIYANNPVNYVKVDRLPGPEDWSPIIAAMKRGDYFVTSGEVLIPSYVCRRLASTGSRSHSTRPARNGCGSPCGILQATARWFSPSSCRR